MSASREKKEVWQSLKEQGELSLEFFERYVLSNAILLSERVHHLRTISPYAGYIFDIVDTLPFQGTLRLW
jgi:hypothetical protein